MVWIREAVDALKNVIAGFLKALRDQAVEAIELEAKELETTFYMLVAAPLAGIPLAPTGLVLELAHLLGEELDRALQRLGRWADLFADYFASLGGEW
ncbi:hypothetical protein Pyrfu_0283 [Pyrolobus fumarii 1A]|uniref:Uncharacterized protein n=1 Tax=Pyrolobus fumarii (strain DSM 11204 / 1A) TaxID=694429 RepID=G0EFB2_PYRF1|nr:hypothetical protein [Pyrolobus fumarii]AEM38155.1 hypothetical protein Pyrfu_0283 [Pyrolobus fumarii 1A]